MFLANLTFAQDIIILKNGEEIKSKVIEVSSDLIKYKKWENQEGPTYSSNKSDVFMIKYINGTKDVFNLSSNSVNQSAQNISNNDNKNEALETLNIFFKNRFNNDKVFKMLGLDKSNGVMKNMNGQSVYEIDYKLKLEFISDAWVKSFYGRVYFDKNFTTFDREPIIEVFDTKTSNSYLFNKGKVYLFSGTATLENTDNGYRLKDYDIKKVDYVGMSSQQYSEARGASNPIIRQTTTHKGFFFDKIPGESYFSRYIINRDESSSPSIHKNIFFKEVGAVLRGEKFGIKDKYNNDELVINKGESLILNLKIGGDVIKYRSPLYSGVWIGNGEYTITIQVEDSNGKECYRDSWERVVKTRDADITEAGSYNEIIKISPEKLQSFPERTDLYLSFFVQGKNKKQMVEGFLKFKVEY